MKEYILRKNGTCVKAGSKEYPDIKYRLLDISTVRKGPIYTLVDGNQCPKKKIECVEIDISIGGDESPVEEIRTICLYTKNKKKGIYDYYKILPFIKGINQYSYFLTANGLGYYQAMDIRVWIEGKCHLLSSEKKINSFFKKNHLLTNVNRLGEDIIAFHPYGKWKICSLEEVEEYDAIIEGFPKFFIPIPYAESGYLLSRWYLHDLLSLKAVTFRLFEKKDIEIFSYQTSNVLDILHLLLYIPQLVLMEQLIYDEPVAISLEIEKDNFYNRSIYISEEEGFVDYNICLYDILKKLLTI